MVQYADVYETTYNRRGDKISHFWVEGGYSIIRFYIEILFSEILVNTFEEK